ncbi:hypothetical protein IC582_008112 [Cucumis melo]
MKDSFHIIFNLYNAIVVVKIIKDRSTKGKCYGFVTFTNPQSTIDAIKDMDGRTIEGRVVRVNGVKVGILSDSSSHHPIRCCPPLSKFNLIYCFSLQ